MTVDILRSVKLKAKKAMDDERILIRISKLKYPEEKWKYETQIHCHIRDKIFHNYAWKVTFTLLKNPVSPILLLFNTRLIIITR